jgi:hypothetical protein
MTPKDVILNLRASLSGYSYEELEEFYKGLAYMAQRYHAMLEFQRKAKNVIEFPNSEHSDISFKITLGGNPQFIHFYVRNPTALHQDVGIRIEEYLNFKGKGELLLFAVPQAADPSYYTSNIAKSTDGFVFYIANSSTKNNKAGDCVYFKLEDLKLF